MCFDPARPLDQCKFVRRECRTYRLVTVIPLHFGIIYTKIKHVLIPANISANVVYCAFEAITETASKCDLVIQPDNRPNKMIREYATPHVCQIACIT